MKTTNKLLLLIILGLLIYTIILYWVSWGDILKIFSGGHINEKYIPIAQRTAGGIGSISEEKAEGSDALSPEGSADALPNSSNPANSSLATITAYSTDPHGYQQTSCLSASGKNLCQMYDQGINTVACPSKYEFGTKFLIEGTEFECWDRMAARFRQVERYDIYMGEGEEGLERALNWGIRHLEVYEL
jgi:hypothetical protein